MVWGANVNLTITVITTFMDGNEEIDIVTRSSESWVKEVNHDHYLVSFKKEIDEQKDYLIRIGVLI